MWFWAIGSRQVYVSYPTQPLLRKPKLNKHIHNSPILHLGNVFPSTTILYFPFISIYVFPENSNRNFAWIKCFSDASYITNLVYSSCFNSLNIGRSVQIAKIFITKLNRLNFIFFKINISYITHLIWIKFNTQPVVLYNRRLLFIITRLFTSAITHG